MNGNTRSVKRTLLLTGVPALLVTLAGLGLATVMPPTLSPVANVQAAESGHEGGCSDCGGESGSTHGSGEHGAGGTHGGHAGGEKGYGRGGPGGHAEGGHDIGDTIFRGQGYRSGSKGRGSSGAEIGIGDAIFRGQGHRGGNTSHSAEEQSDRPSWAGGGGKPNAGRATGGSNRGSTYGNFWVILRDPVTGAPILDGNGHVQPILADGTVVRLTDQGDLPDVYSDQVQTVEFSRLNVSRSPSKVTDTALQRALDTIRKANEITYDAAGRLVAIKDGEAKTIDSPLENLALYEDAIKNGAFTAQQAAAFLGAAADKTQPISLDIVVYLNTILGLNGTSGANYVDYSHFTYNRAQVYSGDVTYLVADGDGAYHTAVKPIIEAVFHNQNVDKSGADAFAQAADDARAVIQFVHDNTVGNE